MKRGVILGLLLGLLLLGSARFAPAQQQQRWIRADIPFDFQVSENRTMPKGVYTFGINLQQRLITIQASEQGTSIHFVPMAEFDSRFETDQITVAFERMGDRYLFKEITYPMKGRCSAVMPAELYNEKLAREQIKVKADAVGK